MRMVQTKAGESEHLLQQVDWSSSSMRQPSRIQLVQHNAAHLCQVAVCDSSSARWPHNSRLYDKAVTVLRDMVHSPLVSDWERSFTAAQVVAVEGAGGFDTTSSFGRGGLQAGHVGSHGQQLLCVPGFPASIVPNAAAAPSLWLCIAAQKWSE